ncbi:unnamed protein product [Rotaria socialis]|uniref:Uncharacterized protein n=1 Tax=Rotaria socialis TaxID=392032 RepID=A0A818QA02_9BILA|nr:unnamed protein product [Rotaria socialis]
MWFVHRYNHRYLQQFNNANLATAYPNETDIRVLWCLSLLNVAFEQQFQDSLLKSELSDEKSLQVSLTLCFLKVTGRIVNVSSTQFERVLAQLDTADQVSPFVLCDNNNRVDTIEWLSFARLQTGDWPGTLSLINDLYIAYNRSMEASNDYLTSAYRSLARTTSNLLCWLPYNIQFVSKLLELQKIGAVLPFVVLSDNGTNVESSMEWRRGPVAVSSLMIDSIQVPLNEFPQRALHVYEMAILSTSNRAINILGMARANAQLSNTGEATAFYRMLIAQIDLSNSKDSIFFHEEMDFIDKNEKIRYSASNNLVQFTFIFIISLRVIFY